MGFKNLQYSYPFGSPIATRTWASRSFRFGFNGMEMDNEGMGGGSSTYDYGFRIYNPNLGRFLSVDPILNFYPWNSPFSYAENSPVSGIDIDGLEFYYAADGTFLRRGPDLNDQTVYVESEVKETVIIGYKLVLIRNTSPPSDISNCCSQNKFHYERIPIFEERIVKRTKFVHANHDKFLKLAGWSYNESTKNPLAQKASLGMLNNRVSAKKHYYGFDNINSIDDALAQILNKKVGGVVNSIFKWMRSFLNTSSEDRNKNSGMKSAIAATIYVLTGGEDLSNGAIYEHGEDFYIRNPKYPNAYNESHERGWEFIEGGDFNGEFNPTSYPEQKGTDNKNEPYTITYSTGKNLYAKPPKQK